MILIFRRYLFFILFFNLFVNAGAESICIVHSNDTHGNYKSFKIKIDEKERLVGGMQATSHYLNSIRKTEENVLVIDKGDVMTGTQATEIKYKGVIGGAMIEFLNRMAYDVWCLGNHDFDRGQENALGLANIAEFPTLLANIIYKKEKKLFPVNPYAIFSIGGLKVGIIAMMEEHFLLEVQKEMTIGLDVLPVIPTLNSYVPDIDKKTDLIIVVLHGWYEKGIKIAKKVPGIDIVLVASEDGKFDNINGVLVQSTFGHQRTLGYLKVDVKNDKIISYEEKLIWLWADVDMKPHPQVSRLVKEVDEKIVLEYEKVIGEAKSTLRGLRNSVESELGNWITDVMRWKTGAQIGLHNSGGIRSIIRVGPIKKSDVFNVSPFHNTIVLFELTGQQIKDLLEFDIERGWDRLQISGLKYRYYPKNKKPYGDRIKYIEVNGEVLVKEGEVLLPEKVYSAASNNYLTGHAEDKYFGFPLKKIKDTHCPLNRALMEWLEKNKILDYKVEGRIKKIIIRSFL
ncbi:MAG: bifunctional metallophosphatase/5'-nucleotidase [Candidatus Aminicenantaceae bacterium]